MAIPIGLLWVLATAGFRLSYPARLTLALFGSFIILCGGDHFIDAWYAWHGSCSAYSMLKRAWNFATMVASFITAIVILPSIRLYVAAVDRPFVVEILEAKIARLEALYAPDRH